MPLVSSPRVMRRIHGAIFWVMVVLLPPTLLFWKDSIVYIAFMSWVAMTYAAVVAFQQSRGEQKQDPAEPDPGQVGG